MVGEMTSDGRHTTISVQNYRWDYECTLVKILPLGGLGTNKEEEKLFLVVCSKKNSFFACIFTRHQPITAMLPCMA
jgi:hypothetical protein